MNRWGYAVNAWAPVRREQQERMLKVIAACGFRHIELSCGSGRWQPPGRPEGLLTEEEGFVPRSTADPGDRDAIAATAAIFTDFLSALRADDSLDRLLDATDPALVGIALDTAEFAVAGIDPVTFYRRHRDRVVHVQIKNARQADSRGEYALAHSELNLLRRHVAGVKPS